MARFSRFRLPRAALAAILALPCLAACGAASGPATHPAPERSAEGTRIVQAHPVAQRLEAYGQIVPIALVPIRAVEAGVVAGMRVVPGSHVEAGETLAALEGPEVRSLLVEREGALGSARKRLAAAKRSLAVERRQLPEQLSTLQSVAAAESAVSAAQAALDTARARLRVAQEMRTLRAPSSGTVIAVDAGAGERVAAGETVLTLQSSDRLWLKAIYYGAEASSIRVGMRGRFRPVGGGAAIPVKVAAVAAAMSADGGESVGLVAATAGTPGAPQARWVSGEWGSVTVTGATRMMVAVPTRALIVDRGKWWVLVRTPGGERRQQVVPGPTRGWRTFVEQGLAPGQRVVVQDAYLEFHRGIAKRYTPPD